MPLCPTGGSPEGVGGIPEEVEVVLDGEDVVPAAEVVPAEGGSDPGDG